MLPKLLQILNPEDLRCVQFLRSGRVRVSFREKADRDHFLSEGMRLDDQDIPVTRDAEKVTVLYIRDLPYEVATDDVVDFFSSFGEVLTVERSVAAETPNLCNGNRVLKMVLNEDLPYFISVCGFHCRVWYRGQPIQYFVCRQSGPGLSAIWSVLLLPPSQPYGQRLCAGLRPDSSCSSRCYSARC